MLPAFELPTPLDYFAALVREDQGFPLLEATAAVALDEYPELDIQQLLGHVGVAGPQRVDHGHRPAAHGGDVAHGDHHAAVAREPGHGGHEVVEEAFDGEQQEADGTPPEPDRLEQDHLVGECGERADAERERGHVPGLHTHNVQPSAATVEITTGAQTQFRRQSNVGLSSADPEQYDLPRTVGIKLNDKDIGRALDGSLPASELASRTAPAAMLCELAASLGGGLQWALMHGAKVQRRLQHGLLFGHAHREPVLAQERSKASQSL